MRFSSQLSIPSLSKSVGHVDIGIDAEKNEINVMIDEDDLNERRKNWVQPTLKISTGVLTKYSKLVSDASNGCVTT